MYKIFLTDVLFKLQRDFEESIRKRNSQFESGGGAEVVASKTALFHSFLLCDGQSAYLPLLLSRITWHEEYRKSL